MEDAVMAGLFTFVACFLGAEVFFAFLRLMGIYTTVQEGSCKVYTLFGNVLGVLREPGFYFLPWHLGTSALMVNWVGECQIVDLRLDQAYLRSQPVNSEEGAPMGIGIWYEMWVHDPIAILFKNVDPRGSLGANVSSSTIRCLSNMPLAAMLGDRHQMSLTVRTEVQPQSLEWGYKMGSTYIRKVHFRDERMIDQIEEKVVNRLRQVTSAIKQGGANQVRLITSGAERRAAVDFARAAAIRPAIVGKALAEIGADPEIASAVFEILEIQRLLEGKARLILLPPGGAGLAPFLLSQEGVGDAPVRGARPASGGATRDGATSGGATSGGATGGSRPASGGGDDHAGGSGFAGSEREPRER